MLALFTTGASAQSAKPGAGQMMERQHDDDREKQSGNCRLHRQVAGENRTLAVALQSRET